MRILSKMLLLCLVLSLHVPYAEARFTPPAPFTIKLVEKPEVLVTGERQTFVLEIKNITRAPVTLSLFPGFTWSMSWNYPDGTGRGVNFLKGPKNVSGRQGVYYEISDFVTLPAKGAKRLSVDVAVPTECDVSKATVTFRFESQYDGGEVGLAAWTGEAKEVEISLPVKSRSVGR